MTRPRVFITQENDRQNYVPAEKFGEVVFLTRREVSPIKNSLTNTAIVDELRRKLADFLPDIDFLAPSGSPIVTGIAFMLLRERGWKHFNALRWSNRDGAYQVIPVNLNT